MTGELVRTSDHGYEIVEAVEIGAVRGDTPKALVAAAVEAANELAAIITSRSLFSNIQGKRYVKCEGWTTLAAIMGCLPREVEVTEKDGTYVAIVELHRIRDDALMGRASAECGMAEPTWKSRAPYARRSMAVTRATSKACRIAFSWVMTLAGFEVTPAEEIPQDEQPGKARGAVVAEGNNSVSSPQAPRDAAPAPMAAKDGITTEKRSLSQKNVNVLLGKAENANTLSECVSRALDGVVIDRISDAKAWPQITANEYDAILREVELTKLPVAVAEADMEADKELFGPPADERRKAIRDLANKRMMPANVLNIIVTRHAGSGAMLGKINSDEILELIERDVQAWVAA